MRWGVAGGEDCAAVYWEAMHEVVAGGGETALAVKAAVTLHSNPGITLFCFQSFSGIEVHCRCTEIPDCCT
jgi:hypothetical protein